VSVYADAFAELMACRDKSHCPCCVYVCLCVSVCVCVCLCVLMCVYADAYAELMALRQELFSLQRSSRDTLRGDVKSRVNDSRQSFLFFLQPVSLFLRGVKSGVNDSR